MTLDLLLREKCKRWTGSWRGIVRPPLFSRASSADAAERVWSAVTVPNVARRGLPWRRSPSTQNLDPSGWPRSMIPRSVADRELATARLCRERESESESIAQADALSRGCRRSLSSTS